MKTTVRPTWLTRALRVFDAHYLQDAMCPETALSTTERELRLTERQVETLMRAVGYDRLPD